MDCLWRHLQRAGLGKALQSSCQEVVVGGESVVSLLVVNENMSGWYDSGWGKE